MEAAEAPTRRLYSPGQIALAAFLGSPLAACWFWAANYRRLGQSAQATKCLVWGVVGTAALLAVVFLLPDWFPSQAIPIAYVIGLFQAARQTHGAIVAAHRAAGGRLGSWWVVVGISLLFLALFMAVVFAIAFGMFLIWPAAK